MKKSNNLNKQAYQSLLISGVLWGFTPLFYKKSLIAVSVLVFLALRFTIAGAFVFATERKKFVRLSPKLFIGVVIFALVDMLLINVIYSVGIQKTTILHAAVISLLNPFLVYLFAAIILKERPHKVVLVGSSIAVVGLLIIVLSSAKATGSVPSTIAGDIILSLGAMIGAFTVVISRKILSQKKRVPPEQLGFMEYAICAIPVIAIVIATSGWQVIGTISGAVWLWIIAASIISGAFPIVMYYRSAKKLRAERLADISFVIPAISSLVGIIYMGEQLTLGYIAGASLVIFGLLIGHKKLHPILVAHKIGMDASAVQQLFRQPKKAYAYIAVESKSIFNK